MRAIASEHDLACNFLAYTHIAGVARRQPGSTASQAQVSKQMKTHLAGFCLQPSKLPLGRKQCGATISFSARTFVATLQ